MENLNLFKEHYFDELSRRDNLNSSLSFPVGVLVVLLGAIFAMLSRVAEQPVDQLSAFLLSFLGAGFVALALAICFLIRAAWNYVYRRVSLDTELFKHQEKLVKYQTDLVRHQGELNKYYGKSVDQEGSVVVASPLAADHLASEDFQRSLAAQYADATGINFANNNRKSLATYNANLAITFGLGFVAISGAFFIALEFAAPAQKKAQIITIVTQQGHHMTATTEQQKPEPPKDPPPPAPEKPQMPPAHDIGNTQNR